MLVLVIHLSTVGLVGAAADSRMFLRLLALLAGSRRQLCVPAATRGRWCAMRAFLSTLSPALHLCFDALNKFGKAEGGVSFKMILCKFMFAFGFSVALTVPMESQVGSGLRLCSGRPPTMLSSASYDDAAVPREKIFLGTCCSTNCPCETLRTV